MKNRIAILKALALSSSALLFGGCVAYQGGAFKSILGAKAAEPASTPPELWPGTKSITFKGVTAGLEPANTPPEAVPPTIPANRPPM